MKFYVNGKMITTKDSPLIVILEKGDKYNIANMGPGAKAYCQYEKDDYKSEDIEKLLDEALSK